MRNPFARPKPRAKRKEPRRVIGRVRLYGEEKTELRRLVFERSGGFCEAIIYCDEPECQPHWHELRPCRARITWETFELSHKRHGPWRSDTEADMIASCKECHRNEHNAGGKPVPRKAGRKMNLKESNDYWKGTVCWCGDKKGAETSFCQVCWGRLSDQSRYDLLNTLGRDYIQTVALAEKELLAWKPAEEQR